MLKKTIIIIIVSSLALFLPCQPSALAGAHQAQSAKLTDQEALAAFMEQVKQYIKLREKLAGKLPKLSKESSPEKIEAHQVAFQETTRNARAGAKQGDLFSADVATAIRRTIKEEIKGEQRKQVKEVILEADTKGVPLRVNHPYPDTKELAEVPPTLLLKLPQLPKQVQYRFVGRHLLLIDTDTKMIIDYMLNALP